MGEPLGEQRPPLRRRQPLRCIVAHDPGLRTGGVCLDLWVARAIGTGGVAAELFSDTSMRLLPQTGGLTREDALELARDLITWPLLDGFRGRPKADVEALVSAIVVFSQMIAQLRERLIEAEINPIFVLPDGQGVRAADGVVVLAGS